MFIVKILINKQAAWITMPVVRNYHGLRNYNEMLINNQIQWRSKIIKTIQASYGRSPFYSNVHPWLYDLIENNTDLLVEYNMRIILCIMRKLGIPHSKIVFASSLSSKGKGTELLISLIKAVNGSNYLAGGGASGYQQDQMFGLEGIGLIFQNFQHPVYQQRNTKHFIPGLSIIDGLMNLGKDGVKIIMGIS